MANRLTPRDYNPIFDTDFAILVRYDWFPSLLYGSGVTFLKFGLWYGVAASSFIPIFSVFFFNFYVLGNVSILRQYSLVKINDFAKMKGRGKVCVPILGSRS